MVVNSPSSKSFISLENILIIGNGGRENSLAWAIQKNELVKKVYLIPDNAGSERINKCERIKIDVNNKNELLEKLKSLVTIEPQLIKQEAGIRPTVKDRRALLGTHPIHDNMYVFNGLGTRGLLISPFLCSLLIDYMENKVDLDHEVDVKRYENEFKC